MHGRVTNDVPGTSHTEADLEAPKAAQPTVLFVGRRFERKGGPTLLAAFARVRAAIPEAWLLIAGSQPEIGGAAATKCRAWCAATTGARAG